MKNPLKGSVKFSFLEVCEFVIGIISVVLIWYFIWKPAVLVIWGDYLALFLALVAFFAFYRLVLYKAERRTIDVSFIETMREAVVVFDKNFNIKFVNENLLFLMKETEESLMGQNIKVLFPDYEINEDLRICLNPGIGAMKNYDYILKSKNGEKIPVRISCTNAQKNYQQNDYFVIMTDIKDIAERTEILNETVENSEQTRRALLNALEDTKELEDSLRFEKERMEAIIDSMGEGLILVDNEMRPVIANKKALSIFGVTEKQIIGADLKKLGKVEINNELVDLSRWPCNITLSQGESVVMGVDDNFIFVLPHKKVPLAITTTPLKRSNMIVGAILIFRDVTEERAVNQSRVNFISVASHQLRTPLSAIRWISELLLDEKNIGLRAKSYVEDIHTSIIRLVHLVNSLLNVSRLESGRVKISPEPVQLEEVLTSVLDELNIAAKGAHCAITLSKPKKKFNKINLDKVLIRQVFTNLLDNAIRYSPQNECFISITIKEKDRKNIQVDIADKGIGIPKSAQEHIFEKFFRADNAVGSQTQGTGIGLYIIKNILDYFGGSVSFKSKENKGTTFSVVIPKSGMKMRKGEVSLINKGYEKGTGSSED